MNEVLATLAPSELATGWVAFSALAGLVVGSFLNVVIHRCQQSLVTGVAWTWHRLLPKSGCAHCGAPIRALDNIPLLSFLCLRGRCRHCQSRISWRYPVVEAGSSLLCAVVGAFWGPSWTALFLWLWVWLLLCLAFIDLKTRYLPDALTLPTLWLGLLCNSTGALIAPADAIWGAALGYVSLWLIHHIFLQITGKDGMGYGDFKLMAAIGAWLGWTVLPLVLTLAAVSGATVGLVLSLIHI